MRICAIRAFCKLCTPWAAIAWRDMRVASGIGCATAFCKLNTESLIIYRGKCTAVLARGCMYCCVGQGMASSHPSVEEAPTTAQLIEMAVAQPCVCALPLEASAFRACPHTLQLEGARLSAMRYVNG